MKKQLIIFGLGEIAQLAHYYFTHDSEYEIVAFTVDSFYINTKMFCGLPVVAFEKVHELYNPNDYSFFIALSYSKLNEIRKSKYLQVKSLGYKLASYISSKASIYNDGLIGENCFIFEDNTIQPFVKIGNNITLWSGNHIGHHSIIKDHCFIASHVVISGGVEIQEQCFIGVNATLRDHIIIGKKCIIGAGTLILSNTDPEGLYIGSATKRSELKSTNLKKI